MVASSAVPVHSSNTEQLRAWDGDEGAFWAAHAERFERAMAGYHGPFLDAAGISGGDHVLDIGCGNGQTTRDAARVATAGLALGVDLSSAMLDHARRRAAEDGLANARFEQVDAQIHPFDSGAFDIVISRAGAMFFGDLGAAFSNIASAMRPGGRLVLLTWQPPSRNEWIGELSAALAAGRERPTPSPDAAGPFSLSDPDRVVGILSGAGFAGVGLEGLAAPMWFGTDAEDADNFVLGLLGWMLESVDETGRARALDALRASTAAHETAEGVVYESAAWMIRAIRP